MTHNSIKIIYLVKFNGKIFKVAFDDLELARRYAAKSVIEYIKMEKKSAVEYMDYSELFNSGEYKLVITKYNSKYGKNTGQSALIEPIVLAVK